MNKQFVKLSACRGVKVYCTNGILTIENIEYFQTVLLYKLAQRMKINLENIKEFVSLPLVKKNKYGFDNKS